MDDPAGSTPARWSFTASFTFGFVIGQGTIILLAFLFLKYMVLDPAVPQPSDPSLKKTRTFASLKSKSAHRRRRSSHAASHDQNDKQLLAKLGYDITNHPSEATDWLNILVAQAVSTYRSAIFPNILSDSHEQDAKSFMEDILNPGKSRPENDIPPRNDAAGMVSLDYISVTEIDIGEEYPVLSNARVRPSDSPGFVRIEIDVDYSDHVTLGIETKIVCNFPKPRFAIIPINLGLTLIRFSATLTLEIPPVPTPTSKPEQKPVPTLYLSLHPDFTLQISATSLIGSRAKLQDIPKVEQLILSRLRGFITDKLVWPKKFGLRLPTVSNSKKATEPIPRRPSPDADYVFVESSAPPITEPASTDCTPQDTPAPPSPEYDDPPDHIPPPQRLSYAGSTASASATASGLFSPGLRSSSSFQGSYFGQGREGRRELGRDSPVLEGLLRQRGMGRRGSQF